MGTTEENVDLVHRFYEEAINQRDSTVCERLLTDDFVHNGQFRGREGQQVAVDAYLAAFPDLKHKMLLTVAEEDRVAARQQWTGTHQGKFLGIEPTGRKVEFTSNAILLVHKGMIAQAWDEVDLLGVLTQLKAA